MSARLCEACHQYPVAPGGLMCEGCEEDDAHAWESWYEELREEAVFGAFGEREDAA